MDDRNQIANCVGALATHVDALRWEDLRGLFAETVETDYTSLFGGDRQSTSREQLIDGWRQLLPGFTRTTHVIGTPDIAVDRDTALVSAAVVAWHSIKDPALVGNDTWLVGGCYEMVLDRREGRWRIASLTLARAWAEGNKELPRLAAERAAASAGR